VVTGAQFSPDGRLVVSAGSDNKARLWEISTGEALSPPLEHNGTVAYACFSSDSRHLLTIGKDNTVRLWELPGAKEKENGKTIVQAPATRATAMNSGVRQLTNLKSGNAVQVIDAVSKTPIGPPLQHRSTIEHAELSLDGRFVVTASADNTAQVWDAVTGARVIPPCQHKGTVRDAAFSSDGRRLITASEDRSARVWDAPPGEPLTPPLKRNRAVVSAYFSPDGSQAITECADRTRRSWNLVPDDRPVTTLVLLAEVLAGSRLNEEHGALPLNGKDLRSAWQELRSSEANAVRSSSK
jgi:WD40 repeat protein